MDPRECVKVMLRAKLVHADLAPQTVSSIELGVYNSSIEYASRNKIAKNWGNPRFLQLYAHKARSTVVNLDPASYVGNTRLHERLLTDHEFEPEQLAHMKRDNLFPDKWRLLIDHKLRRDEHILDEKPAAMTDQYKCSRCHRRETTFYELQLRSADEPSTIFVCCVPCGHRWRMG